MLTNLHLTTRYLIAICLASVALLSGTFVLALTQWYADWHLAHTELPPPAIPVHQEQTTQLIQHLPASHLFGQSINAGNMPITSLELRVTGIMKSDNEAVSPSKAYISMSGQPSKLYQTGDALPYGVRVYGITTNAVILENDGHFEKLPLPREPLQFKLPNTEDLP